MRRFISMAVMLVMVLAVSSDAFAQRDSGAKARGDMGGFWNARYSQRTSTSQRRIVPRGRIRVAPVRRAGRIASVPPMLGQAPVSSTPATTPVSIGMGTTGVSSNRVNLFARNSTIATNTTSKPPWMYQKTDPRRYRH